MKKILCLILCFITAFTNANSQAGTLDSSFGINGFAAAGNYPSLINSVIEQPNGRILLAGGFAASGRLILGLKSDGNIDSTFGVDGFAALNNPNGGAFDILQTIDGKILVCGGLVDELDRTQSFVARFTAEGKADFSFGVNGTSILPQISGFASYEHIIVKEDGSIIVGGSWFSNDNLDTQCILLSRLSPDGVFDDGFGNGGRVFNLAAIRLKAMALQPDGKIVLAGYNFAGGFQQQDFVFARCHADGNPDTEFGNNGSIVMDGTGGEDVPHKIIIQPDGKIVIGGASGGDTYYMSALRLNSNGSLDNTFGNGGKVFIRTADQAMQAFNMLQQPDGKLVLTGGAYDYISYNLSDYKFGLCRISSKGILDSSFGVNGVQITQYKSGNEAYASCLQSDGKIVLGGYYYQNGFQRYLMARYNNDISVAPPPTPIARVKRWLHKHGITWDDCPPSICNNITSYAVQRSSNGINWSTIFRSQLTARSSQPNNSYADPSPLPGANYYRLQTTSVDGAVAYSNVVAINNELSPVPLQAGVISISPNPAKSVLRIEGLPSPAKIKITVVNLAGNVACSVQLEANSPSSYNLNISSLKPGNYLLRVETEGEVATRQFVKE